MHQSGQYSWIRPTSYVNTYVKSISVSSWRNVLITLQILIKLFRKLYQTITKIYVESYNNIRPDVCTYSHASIILHASFIQSFTIWICITFMDYFWTSKYFVHINCFTLWLRIEIDYVKQRFLISWFILSFFYAVDSNM